MFLSSIPCHYLDRLYVLCVRLRVCMQKCKFMAAFIVLGKYLLVLNTISLEIDQNFDLFMM